MIIYIFSIKKLSSHINTCIFKSSFCIILDVLEIKFIFYKIILLKSYNK